jgi:hypothetical protein
MPRDRDFATLLLVLFVGGFLLERCFGPLPSVVPWML